MDDHRDPPYEAHAAIAGTFLAGLGVVSMLARRSPPATALEVGGDVQGLEDALARARRELHARALRRR